MNKKTDWTQLEPRICEECGEKYYHREGTEKAFHFKKRRFCSILCNMSALSQFNTGKKSHNNQQKKRVCIQCGKEEMVSPIYANRPYCSRDCMQKYYASGIMKGKNHWNWQGGITEDEGRDSLYPGYKEWRRKIYKRDGYKCILCGCNKSGELQSHHIKPVKTHKDLIFDVSNGMTVCKNVIRRYIMGKYKINYKGIELEIERLPNGKFKKPHISQFTKQGLGSVWLDDVRIPCGQITTGAGSGQLGVTYNWSNTERTGGKWENKDGRFPANLLVSDDILDDGEIRKGQQGIKTGNEPSAFIRRDIYGDYRGYSKGAIPRGDAGSFSRYFSLDRWFSEQIKKLPKSVQKTFPYFIVSKPTRAERNMGCEKLSEGKTGKQKNTHPTIKPIKLLSYLIVLGSREGDVVLDPFIGSGTTALACLALSRHYVGIEIEGEYVQIAQARIDAYNKQLRLF